MEEIIFLEVSSRFPNASIILPEEVCVPVLRLRISSATTANPLPASPALAASMLAFKASRLVWEEILVIVPVSSFTSSNSWRNSVRIFSSSEESSAMVFVVFTTSSSSDELASECLTDSLIRPTISSIRSATFLTCVLISSVISMDDMVRSCNTSFFLLNSVMLSTTAEAPCIFSSDNSRTTVMPSTIVLLAVLT